MRGRFIFAAVLCLLLLSLPGKAGAEGRWYLRVIARDNSPAAQAEKLRLRDAALSACPPDAGGLAHALPALAAAAAAIAPCRVEIRRWSPDEKIPAAPTVYITIGAGNGRNWWGLLYEDALIMARAGDTPDAEPLPEGEIEFVWPFLTWLKNWLGLGGAPLLPC